MRRVQGQASVLGLYVARETALAHGGSISVESDETDGTTFTVCLPKN